MPFVFAKVSDDDREFFESLDLKNCWGNAPFPLTKDTKWCIDRERNACLVRIGGGYQDMPNFHDFWWNGNTIRLEVISTSTGNYEDGLDITWNIVKLPIPETIWDKQNQILEMLYDAFSVDLGWYDVCEVNSVIVNIACTPEPIKAGISCCPEA